MKYIPESFLDVTKLCNLYCDNLITAEEYYEAVEVWAATLVRQGSIRTVEYKDEWKSWIDTESIRGDRKSWRQRFKDWSGRVSSE